MDTDCIEKKTILRAERGRVWRAVSDSAEFGHWFGVKFDGPFVPGALMRGVIVPTKVDAEVAANQEPYAGATFEITIETMELERLFSFRWHPFAVDKDRDYSAEPTTLVSFALEDVAEGTLLILTESGFDQVPLDRRARAFEMNDGGWTAQMMLVEKYLGA